MLGEEIDVRRVAKKALVQSLPAMLAFAMATLTIRQLDDKTKSKLRVRAAQHGRSMEEEAREILRSALRISPAGRENLANAIRQRFAPLGGVELELPRRDPIRQTAPLIE
jgi:plasmid stability protein